MNIKKKRKVSVVDIILAVFLTILALIAILPFVLMVLFSLTNKKILDLSFDVSTFGLQNYIRIFTQMDIGRYFLNSAIIVVGACFLVCAFGSMAAYGFAKKKFPGRDKLFWVYLSTMMVPSQVTLIPVFVIMKKLGLVNTYWALMIPSVNAFGAFLIRQFIISLPDDLFEAARLDGCSEFKVFTSIVLPLIKPVLISLTVITFRWSWNDYMWPLILTTTDKMQTLTLSVATLAGKAITDQGLVMAGATLCFLPPFILYLILQKQFTEGIALSGIKG